MTVDQTDVVDWLGLERMTGEIVLTIVDDLDWSNEGVHLFLLQEKLNRYLAFIESGEVFECLAEQVDQAGRDAPIKIQVLAKFEPTTEALRFVEHAQAVVKGAGVGFEHRVLHAED